MKKLVSDFGTFKWYDVIEPNFDELKDLSQELKLPIEFLKDCLDPVKLPKMEKTADVQFFLFRIFDALATTGADSVPSLTRKVAVFLRADLVLTIHRMPEPQFTKITEKCLKHFGHFEPAAVSSTMIFSRLFEEGFRTYFAPLLAIEDDIEDFEVDLFSKKFSSESFQKIHQHRRQLGLFKRLMIHSQDLVVHISASNELDRIVLQDLKETLNHVLFLIDELLEDTTNLLSLQISLASQKTNEVMRVLTLFSVFFMPLTFIVGVYGMNFQQMPELHWEFGYYAVWVVMIVISFAIGFWFRKKEWV